MVKHNRRLRLLMVMDSLSVGGTETHVLSLLKPLMQRGVSITYAGASGTMYEAYMQAGCSYYHIDLTPGTLMKEGAKAKAIHALKQVMKLRQIDVVHVHQTPSGLYAAEAACELGIACVFTAHGAYYAEDQLHQMNRWCQEMISVSDPVKAHLARMGIPSTVVSNGVDLEQFRSVSPTGIRERLGIPGDARVVLYASRLAWDKAIVCSLLMMASRRLRMEGMPNLYTIIAGDGNQADEIRSLMETIKQETGQTFIYMVGSQTQIRDYYAEADLVVGTGRVALEAMACAKPVLAIGNHGYLGLVKPETYEQAWRNYFGDHASLYKATEAHIMAALGEAFADRGALQLMGIQGREWMERDFNVHQLAERLLARYESAVCQVRAAERGV